MTECVMVVLGFHRRGLGELTTLDMLTKKDKANTNTIANTKTKKKTKIVLWWYWASTTGGYWGKLEEAYNSRHAYQQLGMLLDNLVH